jgi:hypothetical protein
VISVTGDPPSNPNLGTELRPGIVPRPSSSGTFAALGSHKSKNKGSGSIFAALSRNGQLWISKSRIFVQYLTEKIVFPV